MTDELILARRLFVEKKLRGYVVERAALNGAYDQGEWIQSLLPEARKLIALEEIQDE